MSKPSKTMPEQKDSAVMPEPVILTTEDKALYEHVNSQEVDPPRIKIEDIVERVSGIEMEVKPFIHKGAEYSYAWLDKADLNGPTAPGEKWMIVNRSNHSHVPSRFFHQGCIQYKNQNVLAFCYREYVEMEQKVIVDAYNAKTEKITRTEDQAVSGEIRRIDPGAAGNIVDGGLVDNFVDQAKYPPEKDDF